METNEDFKRGDAYETQYNRHKDDALEECIDMVGQLTIQVEHLITEADNSVEQRNITELYTAVRKIAKLRFYDYSVIIEGKYQVYEENIEYDFSEQITDFLDDALGYNYKELFV